MRQVTASVNPRPQRIALLGRYTRCAQLKFHSFQSRIGFPCQHDRRMGSPNSNVRQFVRQKCRCSGAARRCSAELHSAVPQIFNLLEVEKGRRSKFSRDWPTASRRYRRLKICATTSRHSWQNALMPQPNRGTAYPHYSL
jgi:hypothetical protein